MHACTYACVYQYQYVNIYVVYTVRYMYVPGMYICMITKMMMIMVTAIMIIP